MRRGGQPGAVPITLTCSRSQNDRTAVARTFWVWVRHRLVLTKPHWGLWNTLLPPQGLVGVALKTN